MCEFGVDMDGGHGRSVPAKEGTRRVDAFDVEHVVLVKFLLAEERESNLEKNWILCAEVTECLCFIDYGFKFLF